MTLTAKHCGDHTRHNIVSAVFYKTLQFLTASSLLLALNSSMVVAFSFFLYSSAIVPQMLLAAFLVTFSVYGLNKVTDKTEDSINKPELAAKSTEIYLVGSVASMVGGLVIGLLHSTVAFVILIMPLIIGVIYSIKICKPIPRLKEITGVKSLVVALSWAIPGCFLPALSSFNLLITICIFLFIFGKVFIGATLCDVLDISGDKASGVQTIPVKLGRKNTKTLLILLNSLTLILPIYCMLSGILTQFLPVFVFGIAYEFLAIGWFFSKKCSRISAGLMLDGEWFPLVFIAGFLLLT